MQVGDVVGARTLVDGPRSMAVGYGEAKQLVVHWQVRCKCNAEAWVQQQALELGKAGSCRACGQRRRQRKAA